MIPFTDLAEKAKKVHDKTDLYTSVQVNCTVYNSGGSEIAYRYYDEERGWSKPFPTVQELQTHMDNILYPETDKGVSL